MIKQTTHPPLSLITKNSKRITRSSNGHQFTLILWYHMHMQLHKFSTFKAEWESVLIPFLTSRAILVMTGFLSFLFRANDIYPIRKAVEQGWHFTPYRLLDMWARWDTGWYMSMVFIGPTHSEEFNNLAFFPLYPFLIRASNYFFFDFVGHRTTFTLIAVVISNLAFLSALLIFRKILLRIGFSETFSRGALWLLLIHPFSFFFSAAYTESIFLFLILATAWFCLEKKWLLCAVTSALLMVCRPLGQFVVIPVAISYVMQNKGRIHWRNMLGFPLVPLTFFGYIWSLYLISGDWLILINSHDSFGHKFSTPWYTLTHLDANYPTLASINIAMLIITIVLLLFAFKSQPLKPWSVLGLLLVVTPLFLGIPNSLSRYCVTSFTAIIALQAILNDRPNLQRLVTHGMLAIQVLLFAGWVRFYWVG